LLPWIALLRRKRLDLIGVRRVFLHTGVTLVEVTIVIASTFIGPPRDTTWAWILLGVGTVGCIGGLIWSTKRWRAPPDTIDLSSAESIANSFRALSFTRLGLAASPALYGMVGTELTHIPEFGLVGAGISIVLLALFGPTRGLGSMRSRSGFELRTHPSRSEPPSRRPRLEDGMRARLR
jgi:hypothetical protein